jgi:DNA-binding PadR family transcriptional regulator
MFIHIMRAGHRGPMRHGFGHGLAEFSDGPPWGRHAFWKPEHGKHGRRFGRGDLKFVILDLLQEGPRHGYDVIRGIEERFHGMYSPSPGSVYPTLQLLEDQGYVVSEQQDGKRVYSITDAGRTYLEEKGQVVQTIRSRMPQGFGPKSAPQIRELLQEIGQLGQMLFREGARGSLMDPERMTRVRDIVARARRDIEAVFADEDNTVV